MGARGKLKLVSDLAAVPVDTKGTAAANVQPSAPVKPASVAADEVLSGLWDAIVPMLDDAAMVSQVDVLTLEMAIRHFRAARDASDELSQSSSTLWDEKNEREMKNPAEVIFRSESTVFLQYAKELGLSFVSRARTPGNGGANGGQEENPFAPTGG